MGALVSATGVIAGVLLGSWTSGRREKQQQEEAQEEQARAAEQALYTQVFILASAVQLAVNSLARRQLRGDQSGVQIAADNYMSHRDELRRCVAEVQLLAPPEFVPHAENMLSAAERQLGGAIFGAAAAEVTAAQQEFNDAAEAFRAIARRRLLNPRRDA